MQNENDFWTDYRGDGTCNGIGYSGDELPVIRRIFARLRRKVA